MFQVVAASPSPPLAGIETGHYSGQPLAGMETGHYSGQALGGFATAYISAAPMPILSSPLAHNTVS